MMRRAPSSRSVARASSSNARLLRRSSQPEAPGRISGSPRYFPPPGFLTRRSSLPLPLPRPRPNPLQPIYSLSARRGGGVSSSRFPYPSLLPFPSPVLAPVPSNPSHSPSARRGGDAPPPRRLNHAAAAGENVALIAHHHKKVFPDFYVLGCYSTGSDVQDTDMLIDKALMDVNESPVYLLLNPAINLSQKDLPVIIYESELHVIDESPQLIFVRSNYTIETVEAERIL